MSLTGGQILTQCLAVHGVRRVSSVAGESYLAVLDALLDHPDIQVITNRHEGGAAFMAESWGKLTGEPGVCFVTRGPGACNASIGVHTARQDSTPMILFMGQVGRADKGREAFQEIDVAQVFGGLAKDAFEIVRAADIPEAVRRAFETATSGRPGPVVIGLPEDMLRETADVSPGGPHTKTRPVFTKDHLAQVTDRLSRAARPVAIVGGSTWTDEAADNFMQFASACHLPVAASWRRQDVFNHRHPCFIGALGFGPDPRLIEKIGESDLVLAVGARLNEVCTQGYKLLTPPVPGQTLVHIYPDAAEFGKVYTPALAVEADANSAAAMLAGGGFAVDGRKWAGWREELRGIYERWTAIDAASRPRWQGADMTLIFDFLRDALPPDAVITTDAGNFHGWAQRYLRYGRPGRLLAPISGAMGYAVPAAVGAALAAPDRLTLGLCGDGGFMMTMQELATAAHHGASPVILVCNNNMYGTIRMHQQRDYPGRISATALTNPDFVKLAESFGAFGAAVTDAADFPDIWTAARNAGRAAVIEIKMDPAQITPGAAP